MKDLASHYNMLIIPAGVYGQQDLKVERAKYLMVKIDDPTLALIVRFVGSNSVEHIPQQECMRLQVALIRNHVAQFPREQQEAQAMAWIEDHAQRFREECRGKLLAKALSGDNRCADCPLADAVDQGVCAIHDRWAALLHDFIGEHVSSRDYIEQCLALLREQKDQLRILGAGLPQ